MSDVGDGLGAESPTTTFYFSHAMSAFIGRFGDENFRIWRITENEFLIRGETAKFLAVRKLSKKGKEVLERFPNAALHYILDDDVEAALRDNNLPLFYRARLFRGPYRTLRYFLERGATIHTTSPQLVSQLSNRGANVCRIEASQIYPIADTDHFDSGEGLDLSFFGTRTHLEDLRCIADDIHRFLVEFPTASLTTYLGRRAPKQLLLPNVVHNDYLSWHEYRKRAPTRRFHVCLMPSLNTAVNGARSATKLIECAAVGAAPMISTHCRLKQLLNVHHAGIVVGNEPGAWYEALKQSQSDRANLQSLVVSNQKLVKERDFNKLFQDYWLE